LSKPEPVRTSALASARARGKPDVFQALADPTRRSMLVLLMDKEMAIAELARHLPVSRTAVNKHLRVLSEAGLVSRRRVGRETRCRLRPDPLAELKRWLAFFDGYWDDKPSSLKRFVEAEEDGGFAESEKAGGFNDPGGGSADTKKDKNAAETEKNQRTVETKEDGKEGDRRSGLRAGEWQAWMD